MENSKIGWTHHTLNFWQGCNKVSAECMNCYISQIMRRAGREPFGGSMRTKDWSKPARWNKSAADAADAGERLRVFTCSMSDFFHPGADAWRDEAWRVIRDCTQLDWLILTKRPELISTRLPTDWGDGYHNVWLGVTCGCQKSMVRIDILKDVPAVIRFVSAEPLLEPLDFRPFLRHLDWIITGCDRAAKSKRRRMDIRWVRDINRQCRDAGVAHFFKQAYDVDNGVEVGNPNERPLLDGRVVQEFPAINRNERR